MTDEGQKTMDEGQKIKTPAAQKYQVIDLLLGDPITGDNLVITSPLTNKGDGTVSFEVKNPWNGSRWRHTIRTEEIF